MKSYRNSLDILFENRFFNNENGKHLYRIKKINGFKSFDKIEKETYAFFEIW